MGSSSSAMSSVNAHGSDIPLAIASSSNRKSHLLPKQPDSISSDLPASVKSQIRDKDIILNSRQEFVTDGFGSVDWSKGSVDEHVANASTLIDGRDKNCSAVDTHLNVSLLSNGKKEQIPRTELKTALKELTLSADNMQSALMLVNENPNLAEYLTIATNCILSFKSPSHSIHLSRLHELDKIFFNLSATERTIVGDFLSYLMFCKESYTKYVSFLRMLGLEHFSDSLLDTDDNQNCEIVNILFKIRNMWWNFSDASTVFAAQLVSCVDIIKEVIQNVVSLTGADGDKLKVSYIFESAMGVLHNVGKLSTSRQTFREMKLVDILANFISYKDQPKVTMLVLMVLALIIDENQTHLLTSHDAVFDLMLLLTKQAWAADDHRCDGFSFEELVQAMVGLSRNDEVKKVLVQKGILALMPDTLIGGSEQEQAASAKLLWELSFDPENRIKIQKDEAIMQTVKDLSKHSNKSTARSAQGVLLVIRMERDKEQFKAKVKKSKKNKGNTGHVMISYNWSDQKKLIEIRDTLRNHGYKIWMDIDNLYGSTLQAMAEAVEQSNIVLICMSEKYKESPNCRSEAEYAFSLQKTIVPLIMQSKYKPDGWLGILLGSKLFFNFSGKYPFEKKIDELVKELGSRGKLKDDDLQDFLDGAIIKKEEVLLVKTPNARPSEFIVLDWIKENNLTKFMNLQSLTHEHLLFLKKLSVGAPEFYYSFMLDFISGKASSEGLTELMLVTSALENVTR